MVHLEAASPRRTTIQARKGTDAVASGVSMQGRMGRNGRNVERFPRAKRHGVHGRRSRGKSRKSQGFPVVANLV